jgi:hypothetical protein
MNRKLLLGLAVLYVGLVIALAIIKPLLLWWVLWFTLMGSWVCLILMVRKKKTKVFNDQMAPERAEKRLKWLKAFLLAGGIAFALFVVGVVGHNVVFGVSGKEEEVFFSIAMLGGFVLLLANIGSSIVFLTGQRKPR